MTGLFDVLREPRRSYRRIAGFSNLPVGFTPEWWALQRLNGACRILKVLPDIPAFSYNPSGTPTSGGVPQLLSAEGDETSMSGMSRAVAGSNIGELSTLTLLAGAESNLGANPFVHACSAAVLISPRAIAEVVTDDGQDWIL